jgi:hypothetical protein
VSWVWSTACVTQHLLIEPDVRIFPHPASDWLNREAQSFSGERVRYRCELPENYLNVHISNDLASRRSGVSSCSRIRINRGWRRIAPLLRRRATQGLGRRERSFRYLTRGLRTARSAWGVPAAAADFLGGLSGIVGPQKVGFGSFTIAGQIVRKEIPSNRVVGDVPRKVDREFYRPTQAPTRVLKLNLEYIGQLTALQSWYREVRLARIPPTQEYAHIRVVTQAALEMLSVCIDERVERLHQFLEERHLPIPCLSFPKSRCPLSIVPTQPYLDHIKWVTDLSPVEVENGVSWLRSIVDGIIASETRLGAAE